MPLKTGAKNVGKNIAELYADNKKSGKARGANGKPRSRAQIIAIAESVARKGRPRESSGKRFEKHFKG